MSSVVARDLVSPTTTFPNLVAQKGLLILTVAFSILSLIPSLRFVGSMGTRSTALLSTVSLCALDGAITPATCIKVSAVALGLIGVATGSPTIIIASLAADLAVQSMSIFKALWQKEYIKTLPHLGVIVIDSLAIAAMVTGLWPIIVTACAVNALVMVGLIAKCASNGPPRNAMETIDLFCYAALMIIGIAGAVDSSEYTVHSKRRPPRFHPALSAEQFPTLPITGPAIVTRDLT